MNHVVVAVIVARSSVAHGKKLGRSLKRRCKNAGTENFLKEIESSLAEAV